MKVIQSKDTIWRFHVNPKDTTLYIECKNDAKEFYLWNPDTNKTWHFPRLDQYVCTIVHLQYPYVILSYYHEQNLMNQSILMCYDLTMEQEVWSSSELKLEEIFDAELKVYPAKISPKRYEYINLKKEKIESPKCKEVLLDIQHAEKEEMQHILEYENKRFNLSISESALLTITNEGQEIDKINIDIEGMRTEYDYLIRIGAKILLLVDPREIIVFES